MYGRTIQTLVTRNRWFDIPLTREESLQSDKKLVVNFGPSPDPDGVTMVDSVKVSPFPKQRNLREKTLDIGLSQFFTIYNFRFKDLRQKQRAVRMARRE